MRTTVLNPPSLMSSSRLPSAHASGYQHAINHVGHEQAAEEHDLGDEEYPHAERGRLVLLLHRLEVMLLRRVMRVRVTRDRRRARQLR